MRTDKELLELLLAQYEEWNGLYMCILADKLVRENLIRPHQGERLCAIIEDDCKFDTQTDALSLDGVAGKHKTMTTEERRRFRIDWLKSKIAAL
jgi:hypothetical protein